MAKYAPGAALTIPITDRVTVLAPLASVGPPLLLAELYQGLGRREDAIGLMQQMHDANPSDDAIGLSLVDLLYEDADDEGVIELAAGWSNTSDATLGILHLKVKSLLRSGMGSAAVAEFSNALKKTSGRDSEAPAGDPL
jgi:hypothetical protein